MGRHNLAAFVSMGALALAASADQSWTDLQNVNCFVQAGGNLTSPKDIKAIYDKLPTLDNPTIPVHSEYSETAAGVQLYYCRSSALVLVNTSERNMTIDLSSLAVSRSGHLKQNLTHTRPPSQHKLQSFDPTERQNCSYHISSLEADTSTDDSEALSLGIDFYVSSLVVCLKKLAICTAF